ncbi:PMD domain-containing protein, partial [Cephalotus follicularis]
DVLRPIIHQTGFLGIAQIGHMPLDYALIIALVERWRQDTHTFHMVVGEMIGTLQDVAALQGFQIDSHVVTGSISTSQSWDDICEGLLGLQPELLSERSAISGTSLSIVFLDGSGDTESLMFLLLLANLALVDTYSWGSGILAWLYRSLCKACHSGVSQIDGNFLLLQV